MRRLKICHVLYGLGIGGIETLAVKLVNRMDQARFEHMIISLTPMDDLLPEIKPGAARVAFFDKQAGFDPTLYVRITNLLRRARPDVIHTRNWATLLEGLLPAIVARVPARVHSFDGMNADNLGQEPRRRIWAQRILFRRVQKIVARSEAMREAMCEQIGLNPDRVGLIADGIDLERYDRPVDRIEVRRRFGLAPDDVVVGIVARLDPVKDHRTLFRAIVGAAESIPALKLMVVGGGPLEETLRQEVAMWPQGHRIVFTGPQLDVPSLYHTMDIYAQPSLYEGISGSILEAMAARLPVISTPVGGTVDLVKQGRTGMVVPVGDDKALAEAIVRLHRDRGLARALAEGGRVLVEEQYSLARVVSLYEGAYLEAAERAGVS